MAVLLVQLMFMTVCQIVHSTVIRRSNLLPSSAAKTKKSVNFIDVQTQSSGNDCGLFSIAFAASLCAGEPEFLASILLIFYLACVGENPLIGHLYPLPIASYGSCKSRDYFHTRLQYII